jgi:hypothetical protein
MYNSGYAIVEMHDGMLDVLWYAFICSNPWLARSSEQYMDKSFGQQKAFLML